MKKFKIYILVIFFIVTTNDGFSQNFAYANMEKIINTSNVGKQIISYFSKKNEILIKDIKNKEKIIKEKEKSLISQKNILQEDEYAKKVNLIRKEIQTFNKMSKEKSKVLKDEKEKVSKSFMIEINKILKDFAENNKIDIIFSSNQMLIGKSNLDVTENILKEVNKRITNFKIKNDG